MEPLVSVIINCYNGEKYLREAIDSVINQKYQNWEIIFWDNNSTDGSLEVCKKFSDPRIKIFTSEKHTLLYKARNYAIAKSSGQYLSFLDVDDAWLPNKLVDQIPLFSDPGVGCVYGNYFIVNEVKKRKWLAYRELPSGYITNELIKNYKVGILTLVIKRSIILNEESIFNGDYHIIGDYDAVIRLSLKTKIVPTLDPVALYRIHGQNEFGKSRALYLDEMKSWVNSTGNLPEIRKLSNYPLLSMQINYIKAVNNLLSGNRIEAIKIASRGLNLKSAIKIFFVSVLPKKIIVYLKNN